MTPGSPPARHSDEDRERVIEVLKTSCGDGRLTLDDFSERVGAAYQAVSLPDLLLVLGDLPHPFASDLVGVLGDDTDHATVPTAPLIPDSAPGRRVTHWMVSIMGGSQRRGRWRLREKSSVVTLIGGCQLDLRNAEIEGPEVVINAFAVTDGVEITRSIERRIHPGCRSWDMPTVVVGRAQCGPEEGECDNG